MVKEGEQNRYVEARSMLALKNKATSRVAVPKQENCKKKTKVDTTAVVVVFCKEAKKEDKKTFFRTLVLLP